MPREVAFSPAVLQAVRRRLLAADGDLDAGAAVRRLTGDVRPLLDTLEETSRGVCRPAAVAGAGPADRADAVAEPGAGPAAGGARGQGVPVRR